MKLGHRGLVGSVLMVFVFPAMIVTLVLLESTLSAGCVRSDGSETSPIRPICYTRHNSL